MEVVWVKNQKPETVDVPNWRVSTLDTLSVAKSDKVYSENVGLKCMIMMCGAVKWRFAVARRSATGICESFLFLFVSTILTSGSFFSGWKESDERNVSTDLKNWKGTSIFPPGEENFHLIPEGPSMVWNSRGIKYSKNRHDLEKKTDTQTCWISLIFNSSSICL